ncbi:MAG: hypothetical protein ABSG34_10605 [Candidatus Sulfotelmatobacter sp.]|jgi:hypothetical protein
MEWIGRRTQLVLVAFGYATVLAVSAALIVVRYFEYLTHPADVAAAGGMYAGGDLMLEAFIGGMLLVVTFFLVLVIYKWESAYTIYSKILLGLSLTAPLSVGLLFIPAVSQGSSLLGGACMFRLFASPMIVVGMGMSRVFARFPRAKRLTVYGLLIEVVTMICLMAAMAL